MIRDIHPGSRIRDSGFTKGPDPGAATLGRNFSSFSVKKIKIRSYREVFTLGGSKLGSLKRSTKMGWYFLNITLETAKFRSSLSILSTRVRWRLFMSAHLRALSKNCMRESWQERRRRVRLTPLPSIICLPTVCTEVLQCVSKQINERIKESLLGKFIGQGCGSGSALI
jgi:hypothetical protein